jgi:hypothetical protein
LAVRFNSTFTPKSIVPKVQFAPVPDFDTSLMNLSAASVNMGFMVYSPIALP